MSQQFNELDQLLNQNRGNIDPSIEAGDAAVNMPAELSDAEIEKELSKFPEEAQIKRQEYGNNAKVTRLVANAPNPTKYLLESGITELPCSTKEALDPTDQTPLVGKNFPVKTPQTQKYKYDGFEITEPEGSLVYVPRSEMIEYIMEHAITGIYGGQKKYVEIRIRESSSGLNSKDSVKLAVSGFDQENKESADMLISYEEARDSETNEPLTRNQTVMLDKTGMKEGKEIQVRGKYEKFPVFRRKRDGEFAQIFNKLGEIESTSRSGGLGHRKIENDHDRRNRMKELIRAAGLLRNVNLVQ